jgi:hypothetical protein
MVERRKTIAPNGDHNKETKQYESYQPKMEIRSKNISFIIMLVKTPDFYAPRRIMGEIVQSVTSLQSFGERE